MRTIIRENAMSDFIEVGQDMLAYSYRVLHKQVISDSYLVSRVKSYWPDIVYEAGDSFVDEGLKITYSPRQITMSQENCELFMSLPFESRHKKMALMKATSPKMTWKKLGEKNNFPDWRECRNKYDAIVYSFVIALRDAGRIPNIEIVKVGS